jgi:hypothetical protein
MGITTTHKKVTQSRARIDWSAETQRFLPLDWLLLLLLLL